MVTDSAIHLLLTVLAPVPRGTYSMQALPEQPTEPAAQLMSVSVCRECEFLLRAAAGGLLMGLWRALSLLPAGQLLCGCPKELPAIRLPALLAALPHHEADGHACTLRVTRWAAAHL